MTTTSVSTTTLCMSFKKWAKYKARDKTRQKQEVVVSEENSVHGELGSGEKQSGEVINTLDWVSGGQWSLVVSGLVCGT